MSENEAAVLIERRGTLALVTLNRPQRRNGLTVAMCHTLYEGLREIAGSSAQVVVLRGAGHNFCVGADLLPESEGTARPTPEDLGLLHHASTLLHTMPQVTIAAIDGGCAGAGMGYAAACDFRFASHEARFSTAFLNVGVSGDMGLAWSLNRLLGGARAREMLFFPTKLDAGQMLEFGFVTRLFSRETLHAETLVLAEELCAHPPFALRMMKANMLSAEQLPIADFVDIETARHLQCTSGLSFQNALAVFGHKYEKPKS